MEILRELDWISFFSLVKWYNGDIHVLCYWLINLRCENKDKDAATAIFYTNQEKEKGYFLDGIGSNESKTASIIFESSG
jgi:hypothetical protein